MKKNKIFKENLTSKLIQKHALNIVKNIKNKKICEIGCGDGNISNYLIKNSNKINAFHLSDISNLAIKQAQKKIKYDKVEFKTGDLFKPWLGKKFDIIISDVSSLNQTIAEKSPWYQGVESNCGQDGLRNVKKIIKDIKHKLNKNGVFIIPLISLSDTEKLKKLLKTKFKIFKETERIYWPIPIFFKKNIKVFDKLLKKKIVYFESKFGQYIAYTSVAICKKIK
jgi:methylase of polypeptide subunit release factors